MSPVGGSRHYQGAGLGQVGIWGCPSCGDDNTGPIEQGCVHCGAGRPAAKVEPPPTPPPPAAGKAVENEYTQWLTRHPDATTEQAFIAGYIEGIRAAQRAHLDQARQREAQEPMTPTPDSLTTTADAKTYRTVAAALAMFRDQILITRPEEVETGEWLSAEETTNVIEQILQQLGAPSEVVHA